MHVNYLIIGQGICGTMLSWFLKKEGKTCIVIDDNNENASSRIAAGIINPVTGRRYAYTWMIEEVMPFALQVYKDLGHHFNTHFITEKGIIDFFPSAQMRNAFVERLLENDSYLHSFPEQNQFNNQFQYDFGCGEIRPAYVVALQDLLTAWRKELLDNGSLLEEKFDIAQLVEEDDSICYGDTRSEKIIFCDGVLGSRNPWFELLPYAPNKGEALWIECDGLNTGHIFKKGLLLAPIRENIFWVGSNYQWEFENEHPSQHFFDHAKKVLDGWLKMPYRILSHKAAVRPATLERRPFVGFHPNHPNIGILNGMGTKGTSLAPFFAHQMVQHMVHHFPLSPEADVNRFSRILKRLPLSP